MKSRHRSSTAYMTREGGGEQSTREPTPFPYINITCLCRVRGGKEAIQALKPRTYRERLIATRLPSWGSVSWREGTAPQGWGSSYSYLPTALWRHGSHTRGGGRGGGCSRRLFPGSRERKKNVLVPLGFVLRKTERK